eukprot:CAMPEP_0178500270 /NCGR_PEP_ID=MMETSP0696-20121128/16290_1 /TAXON_ID=265572 /ORGANISM="Extubocellulus spinifer, Strain CCMP396" /LENGTH=160 /DNA_ID=CAMNT_0020129067 /DNA_START=91 /DNA_END=573 /DNA_ORIENTATION=-
MKPASDTILGLHVSGLSLVYPATPVLVPEVVTKAGFAIADPAGAFLLARIERQIGGDVHEEVPIAFLGVATEAARGVVPLRKIITGSSGAAGRGTAGRNGIGNPAFLPVAPMVGIGLAFDVAVIAKPNLTLPLIIGVSVLEPSALGTTFTFILAPGEINV